MDLSKRADLFREVREWECAHVELRDGDDGTLRFSGEASVVDRSYTVTDMFGDFTETVRAGAFDKTLAENPDVTLLINHEGLPLARTTSGTLKLAAEPNLTVKAQLDPSDPDVQRIQTKMRRGDLDKMSFAFRVMKQNWNDDYTDREILEVNLTRGDVSIVTHAANPAAMAALRCMDINATELDAAFTATRAGTADDTQRELLERAHRSLGDVLGVGLVVGSTTPATVTFTEPADPGDDLDALELEDITRADRLRALSI